MLTVDIHEAESQLSELLEKAARGEPFVVVEAGKPMIEVTAKVLVTGAPVTRRVGFLKGQLGNHNFDPDFVDHEIIAMFEGEEE